MTRPFGFQGDGFTPIAEEIATVQQVAARTLGGASLASTCRWLNEQGIRTTAGGSWQPVTLRRILFSPRIAGLIIRDGQEVQAPWPPVIAEDDWRRLRQLISARAMSTPSTSSTSTPRARRERTYLLTGGLARCGLCGAALLARPTRGKRAYVCRSRGPVNGCGRIRIQAEGLERLAEEELLRRLSEEDNVRRLQLALDLTRLATDIEAATRTLAELGTSYGNGHIGGIEFHAASQAARTRLDTTKEQLKIIDGLREASAADISDVQAWWSEASLDARHAAFRLLVGQVIVGPAAVRGSKALDPTRVQFTFTPQHPTPVS